MRLVGLDVEEALMAQLYKVIVRDNEKKKRLEIFAESMGHAARVAASMVGIPIEQELKRDSMRSGDNQCDAVYVAPRPCGDRRKHVGTRFLIKEGF